MQNAGVHLTATEKRNKCILTAAVLLGLKINSLSLLFLELIACTIAPFSLCLKSN